MSGYALKNYSIPQWWWQECAPVGNLYIHQSISIRENGKDSEPGKLGMGKTRMPSLTVTILNICAEELIREAFENTEDGVVVSGKRIGT